MFVFPKAQWAANQKFLDRMIQRGDNVRLSINARTAIIPEDSSFATELQYLQERGYILSEDGWWLKKK
jgi:hypothetical protein